MGEQAKQGVGRQGVAPFEMEHHQHHRGGGGKYADHQLEVEQDGKRNAPSRAECAIVSPK